MTNSPGRNTADNNGQGRAAYGPFLRFLRLFADIRPGETAKVMWLAANVFLLLLAYYILKPLREALILLDKDAPVVKSILSGAQAVLFVFVIIYFSRISSRLPRHRFIAWTTAFFISNLAVFYFLHACGMPIRTLGIIFFIWIGIFNYFVIAQFWGFANDLYKEDEGKRVFPLIALGATLGAVVGTRMKWLRDAVGDNWEFKLMLCAGAILVVCIMIMLHIHHKEIGRPKRQASVSVPEAARPLRPGDGFNLVVKSRYLLLIALMTLICNSVNATGEYIISDAQTRASLSDVSTNGANMEKSIHSAFMDYQLLTNLTALFIQLFLVSRIYRRIGVSGSLLILPMLALGGYGLIAGGAALAVIRGVKSVENGTDYSLQNTTKAALFLVTSREEKYKAKMAIDTFFVRSGDFLSAIAVYAGTAFLGLAIRQFALLNVCLVAAWLTIALLITKEYGKRVDGRTTYPVKE